MANPHRPTSDAVALERALAEATPHFAFFQALRRFECAYPEAPRLGESVRVADDPVRLGQEPSLTFAPASLASFTPAPDAQPGHLAVHCFGLFGPNGPLPLQLTEYARDRLRNADDATFARFLDLFHHRMLALFYRAWANAQPTVSYDRPEADRFARCYVGALFGLGTPALRERDPMPDLAKCYYAGQLVTQTRHAEGLEALLADFFKAPAVITQFVGHWLTVPEPMQLGTSPATGTLGANATIGTRVWDRQHRFHITLGPLALTEYRRLLPGSANLRRLVAVVRNYIGIELDWELNLVLERTAVPPLRLGEAQLGWTSWLTSRPLDRDGDDLLLEPVREVRGHMR